MSNAPENDAHPLSPESEGAGENTSPQQNPSFEAALAERIHVFAPEPEPVATADPDLSARIHLHPLTADEPQLFQNWEQPVRPRTERIPNIGHFALVGAMAVVSLLATSLVIALALHMHLFGVTSREQATLDIHYTLGSEAILYLLTLVFALVSFPMIWGRSFFAGIQWNGATAYRLHTRLFLAAIACFLFAIVTGSLMPGPKDAPIDKIFQSPGAPWLLFAFGISFAPFFEEIFFRGFMLPSLCTACDWVNERIRHTAPPPLGANGHPQWSTGAMITGSIFTSLPFAAVHAAQNGYAVGPFVLLVLVSAVLCVVRLTTRSVASSVLVHASYNFLLFSIMLAGSNGFQHIDKL